MLRILRRYNKVILGVAGILLMIAFLIQGAITGLSQSSGMLGGTWAYVGDQKVKGSDYQQLQEQMRILEMLGPQGLPLPGIARDPVHYYLLRHEASEAGLIGSPADALRSLEAVRAADPNAPSADEMIAVIQARTGASRQRVLETIAVVDGIQRLVGLYESAPKLSDRRLRRAAAEMLAAVDADVVVLDARTLASSLDYEPSDEELQRQLEQYADTVPGPDSPFGYRLPNRLKLEWMTISAPAVRTSLENSPELSNIELRKHRDRNLDLWPKPADGSDDFDQIRAAVREHRLAQLVEERMAEIAKFAGDQLQLSLRGLPRDGAYVKLPPDWQTNPRRVSFESVASEIAKQFRIDLPSYQTSGPEWITIAEIDALPDIGKATSTRFGARPVKASQLLAETRELGGADTYAIQQDVAGPPLSTPAGDVVFFRVIDTDPSRPPTSVDEVREQLVADLKAIEQFRRLEADAERLRQQAVDEGLLAVAAAHGATVQAAPDLRQADPRFLQMGFRMTPSVPGLGPSEDAVAAIVDFALALPHDRPIQELSDSERTFVEPVEDKLALVLGRITEVTPLTEEDYQSLANSGALEQQLLGGQGMIARRQTAFGKDALMARHDFRLSREIEDEAAEADSAPSAPAKASQG